MPNPTESQRVSSITGRWSLLADEIGRIAIAVEGQGDTQEYRRRVAKLCARECVALGCDLPLSTDEVIGGEWANGNAESDRSVENGVENLQTTLEDAFMQKPLDDLRRHLKATGLSAYAIANRAGVGHAIVKSFLTGRAGVSMTTFAKLADAFELRVALLHCDAATSAVQGHGQGGA